MNSIRKIAASLSITLLSLGAAAPAMAYNSGTAPSYDLGCTFHKNGLYSDAGTDLNFEDGFMVWGSSSANLVGDNDNISALLVPQGCYAQVWEHRVNLGSSELFPPGFYSLIDTNWNDKIGGVYCSCEGARTQDSVSFNGTSTYAQAPSGTWISGSFTITAWVYPTATQSYARVIDIGNGAAQDNVLLAASVASTGKPRLGIYKNGVETAVDAPSALTLNAWTHVAATFDSQWSVGKLYINGDLVATNTSMQAPQSVTRTKAYIGKSNWSSDALFKGSLADVRVFDQYAMSQLDIRSLMSGDDYPGTISTTIASEKARYRFSSGSTWYDASIKRANATFH